MGAMFFNFYFLFFSLSTSLLFLFFVLNYLNAQLPCDLGSLTFFIPAFERNPLAPLSPRRLPTQKVHPASFIPSSKLQSAWRRLMRKLGALGPCVVDGGRRHVNAGKWGTRALSLSLEHQPGPLLRRLSFSQFSAHIVPGEMKAHRREGIEIGTLLVGFLIPMWECSAPLLKVGFRSNDWGWFRFWRETERKPIPQPAYFQQANKVPSPIWTRHVPKSVPALWPHGQHGCS